MCISSYTRPTKRHWSCLITLHCVAYISRMGEGSNTTTVLVKTGEGGDREYEIEEIFEAYQRGEISPSDLARLPGMDAWQPVRAVLNTLTYGKPRDDAPRFTAAIWASTVGLIALVVGQALISIWQTSADALPAGDAGVLRILLATLFVCGVAMVWLWAVVAGASKRRTGCAMGTVRMLMLRWRRPLGLGGSFYTGLRREREMPRHHGEREEQQAFPGKLIAFGGAVLIAVLYHLLVR